MNIVTDDRVAKFVGSKVNSVIFPPYTCVGIEKEGEVIGGVIFNCFTGHGVHATVAGRGWTKGFLAEIGHYVFSTLHCKRITVITEQDHVVRIAERLGGKVEGVLRNQFGKDRNGTIVGILKDEWKF